MALSTKKRFNVFKRDAFKCRYCGQSPPSVVLEVDHLVPRSAGGSDELLNLVTSCFACNRGKSNVPLDAIPESVLPDIARDIEKAEQFAAYGRWQNRQRTARRKSAKRVAEYYEQVIMRGRRPLTTEQLSSINTWLKCATEATLCDCVDILASKESKVTGDKWKYFCGICWATIKGVNG
jgi:hypothetical protein